MYMHVTDKRASRTNAYSRVNSDTRVSIDINRKINNTAPGTNTSKKAALGDPGKSPSELGWLKPQKNGITCSVSTSANDSWTSSLDCATASRPLKVSLRSLFRIASACGRNTSAAMPTVTAPRTSNPRNLIFLRTSADNKTTPTAMLMTPKPG